MNDGNAFQKRRKLLSMLDEGLVMVHLDPRPEEVVVPGWLKDSPVLRLNLAYGFRLPALDVGAEGVYAVLSFNKQNFGCTLPWSAIFALTCPDKAHEGTIWPESLPAELAAHAEAMGAEARRGPDSGVGISLDGDEPDADEVEDLDDLEEGPDEHRAATPDAPVTAAPRPAPAAAARAEEPEPRPPAPPLFKVHDGGGGGPSTPTSPEAPAPSDAPPASPERKRSHLKLVKG